ncbi:hypothetical protein PCANC_21510 [Puccinia coronata f. sp. avenae]|uniref:Uncharacterized protein n=1 Tax=Puccinia coronata f. sp. avenae TaxID=200324 RepID=A0A2N5S6Z4_9BASI|nr:hypothetical protein PCANC_21510 [Puccinia coronata f. sp. avenae]
MRVGNWMMQACTLASSGAFQAVLGMGDGFTGGRELGGSSGIGGSRIPTDPIPYRATSEGETGSHDLILELTLGNSGSSVKRKSQHIEPQDDSAGVAGSTNNARRIKTGSKQVGLDSPSDTSIRQRTHRQIEPHDDSAVAAGTIGGISRRVIKIEPVDERSDVLASIQDCLHQKMADLASWKTELSNSPQDELYKEEVEWVISQVKGLFAEKISQLRSTSVQAEELSKSILERWGRIFLVSVFNSKLADITVEGAHGGSRVSRAQRWCETIMDLLLDLQKYQILQDADLSRSLNQRSRGKIIWQYLNARIYPAPDAMFLNFDSQLSLKEDASMKKYSTIIQLLTEDAWKNIELSNIIYNAGGFLKGNPGHTTASIDQFL